MGAAQRLFIGYGTMILIVGFALGGSLGLERMKSAQARALATAHVETLVQAAVSLGLGFAVGAVGFDSNAATVGAWLLVAGSAMQAIGVTSNWLTKTVDQFAERSPGFFINTAGTFVIWPGLVVTAYGILSRL